MYLAEKRSEYKTGNKEPSLNSLGMDEEDDTHKYSIPDETDSLRISKVSTHENGSFNVVAC